MTDAIHTLYTRDILRLAGAISRVGRLAAPEGTASRTSRVCGSSMSVEVALAEDGRIADYAQQLRACAFGQASAALFAEAALGRSAEEIAAGQAALAGFLDGGAPPAGVWEAFRRLEPVRPVRARHGAVLLPFETTLAALQAAA